MELNKVCNKLSKLNLKLENAYMNDINTVINEIFMEFDITYKNQNVNVDKSVIINKFKRLIIKNEKENICAGFSKNGNKCVRKALPENDYCKIHTYLAFKFKPVEQEPMFVIDSHKKEIKNLTHLTEVFIDDSFYYVDGEYAYDKYTKEKAGIFDKESNSYYITDDPFILGEM